MELPTHIISGAGIVENERGEILMVRLARGWEYPGGVIEHGESIIEGVVREIKEESGIDAEVVNLNGVYSFTDWYDDNSSQHARINFDFYCKAIGGKLRISDESSEVKWVLKSRVLDIMNADSFVKYKFEKFLSGSAKVDFAECHIAPVFEVINTKKL